MSDRLQYQINTMKAWIKRREDVSKPWTSDELWNCIRKNWPTLTEEEAEAVFQGCG